MVLGGEVSHPPSHIDEESDMEFDPDEDYGNMK